ncbi:MAG: MFS transporter [Actinomycetota bacterium]|nr:MFS transporter [Actinomycetota bacterium]
MSTLARTFDSLRVRNYRLFFSGQVVSWTGTWTAWVAQGWLVLQLTGSGFGLGVVTALQWLPVLLFGAWAGVIADRFEKRKVLIATNVSSAALSLILGLVTVLGLVELWMVIADALLMGLVTAIDNPTRQTFTYEMVGRERLQNAVSLNTATFTTARVLGPAAAGFLIAGVGIGECFLVNAASFIPITIALSVMDKSALRPTERAQAARGQVREGLRYVLDEPLLRRVLVIMAIVGTLQYNFQVILPVLAKDTFEGSAATLGFLGASVGIGMFAGSMLSAAYGRPTRDVLLRAGFMLGGLSLLTAAAPSVWVAALLMVPLGAASMAFLATVNSTLQLRSSDAMRGRVMALYFVLFLGSTPIGAPIIGWIAETIDARAALATGGIATLSACLYGVMRLPLEEPPARARLEPNLEMGVEQTD